MIIYVILSLIFVFGVLVGTFIERGILIRNIPSIGRLELNFTPGAEDPLQLHISEDIDIDNPPKEVRFNLLINGGK
jgi:hypothetical protein